MSDYDDNADYLYDNDAERQGVPCDLCGKTYGWCQCGEEDRDAIAPGDERYYTPQ